MQGLPVTRQAAEHIGVKFVHHFGGVNHRSLVVRIVEGIHQPAIGLHVFDVQRAMGTEVTEGAFRQRQALADAAARHAAAKAEAEAEAKAEAERSGGGGASDKALPGPPEGIHRTVWEAALSRGVYAPLAPSARCLHATIIGAPGSGMRRLTAFVALDE